MFDSLTVDRSKSMQQNWRSCLFSSMHFPFGHTDHCLNLNSDRHLHRKISGEDPPTFTVSQRLVGHLV